MSNFLILTPFQIICLSLGREDDQILGFTAFDPRAGGELPLPVQIAMRMRLPFHAIGELVVAHSTYAEGLVSLFSNIPPLRPEMS